MRDWTALAAQHPEAFEWINGRPVPIISGGGGGGSPKPPKPTQQELEIQSQQVELLKRQVQQVDRQMEALSHIDPADVGAYLREEVARARELGPVQHQLALRQLESVEKGIKLQDQLQPFVLQSMRLVQEPGGGAIRRMTEEEYVGTLEGPDKLAYQNLTLSLEREAKALRGELPLSEAGQQRKRDEFTAFREQMARAGNPIEGDTPETATTSTTAGSQALKAFTERWGLVEEAERRGELTAGSQSVLARMGIASDIGARNREGMLNALPGYAMPGRIGGTGVSGGGAAGALFQPLQQPNFAGALQPFERQRAVEYQGALAKAQQQQQDKMQSAATGASSGALLGGIIGSIFPVVGTTIGAAAGGLIGGGVGYAASERKVKKDIKRTSRREDRKALDMVKGLKTHSFRYKGESGRTPKRMGMMVDEAPAVLVAPDGRGIDLHRQVGMLTASVRELARKKGR